MLRAALIGFASSGKTTLFHLMTSAREPGRAAHGKGDISIGISKVPDARLDRLTAMYNPRKRVPATVEHYVSIGAQFIYVGLPNLIIPAARSFLEPIKAAQ